jgi:hypothetical protein
LLLTLALAQAAAQPDFSGTWVLDPLHSAQTGIGPGRGSGQGDGSGGGLALGPLPDALTIRQTAGALSIEERLGPALTHIMYRLDGAPTKNTLTRGRNAPRSAVSVSRWDGDRLITRVTVPTPLEPAREATFEEVRYIDSDGSLIVHTTFPERDSPRIAVYTRAR